MQTADNELKELTYVLQKRKLTSELFVKVWRELKDYVIQHGGSAYVRQLIINDLQRKINVLAEKLDDLEEQQ